MTSSKTKVGRWKRFVNFLFRRNKKEDKTSTTDISEKNSTISKEIDSESSNDSEDTKKETDNSELKLMDEDEDENPSSDNSSNSFE